MICFGVDAIGGTHVEVRGDGAVIGGVDELIRPLVDGPFIAPGFVDLQVNGYAGVDYNDPHTPAEAVARSVGVLHTTGVTRFFPTVITGPEERICGALRMLSRARALPECASIAGFHVEGPHISADDGPRGAHPREWVRPPDIEEFRRWQEAADGGVRLVTVAPEWPGATRYIEALAAEGVVVAIGHTGASREQIREAAAAGATLSTHLGNGAHSELPRHPNYLWEQLAEDRLAASFIADGIHLPEAFFRVALRAKGVMRSLLVTDAAMPAGSLPGRYRLGEVDVELTGDGRVVLAGGTRLAGSALRMDRAVANAVRLGGVPLADALTMATRNPARVGRIAGRQRGLAPGDLADLVLFETDGDELRLLETWVGGERVWKRAAA